MSDLGDPTIMPMKPKYQRALVTIELGVSETWRITHKRELIEALERLFGVPAPGVGPGGAVMHALFIRVEDPSAINPVLEQYRLEYPLVDHEHIVSAETGLVRCVELGYAATEAPKHQHACLRPHPKEYRCNCECGAAREPGCEWSQPQRSAHAGDDVPAYPMRSLEFNEVKSLERRDAD